MTRAFAVGVLLVCSTLARAEAPAPMPANDAAQAESRVVYERGVRLYDLGDFGGAVAEFKHAYELTETPALLFNIAQCDWQLGAFRDALYLYESYLRAAPHAANRDDVEARIAELQRKLKTTPAAVPVAAPPVIDHRPSRMRLGVGLGLSVLGVVALASGAGLLGRVAADDTRLATVLPGTMWNSYYRSIDDDRRSSRLGGAILLSVGVGALAGGAALCVIAFRSTPLVATASR